MSLKVYEKLVQGSDEWLEQRRGMVTASVVGQLITAKTIRPASNDYSRALTALLVAERITGWVEPVYVSHDMLRGTLDEPLARATYSANYAPVTEVGFMVREFDGCQLGYSPDGLVGDYGLIEIKSRRPKEHLQTILADEVPTGNMAQMQAGMLVSGRRWCDYISYAGGMPLWVKRVEPDTRWQSAITEAVALFEAAAEQMVGTYGLRIAGRPTTERSSYDMDVVV